MSSLISHRCVHHDSMRQLGELIKVHKRFSFQPPTFAVTSSAHVRRVYWTHYRRRGLRCGQTTARVFLALIWKIIKAELSKKCVSCRRWLMFCLVLFMGNCYTHSLVSGPLYLSPGNELVAWIQHAVSYFHWIKQDRSWKTCIYGWGGEVGRCCMMSAFREAVNKKKTLQQLCVC